MTEKTDNEDSAMDKKYEGDDQACDSPTLVPVKIENDALLSLIEKIALTPDIDVTKMQTIMNMRVQQQERTEALEEKERARQAKLEFDRDYCTMANEMPLVIRQAKNGQTQSNYAKHEDINEPIKPILCAHGFALSFDILEQTKDNITILVILTHNGGHQKTLPLTMPIDTVGVKGNPNKTVLHGIASTITYIKRVAICLLLNISTGDDKDGNKPLPQEPQFIFISEEQLNEITTLLDKSGADKISFIRDYLKIDTLNMLLSSKYNQVVNRLNARIKENSKKVQE